MLLIYIMELQVADSCDGCGMMREPTLIAFLLASLLPVSHFTQQCMKGEAKTICLPDNYIKGEWMINFNMVLNEWFARFSLNGILNYLDKFLHDLKSKQETQTKVACGMYSLP